MTQQPTDMEKIREQIARRLAFASLGESDRLEFENETITWIWVEKNGFVNEYLVKASQLLTYIQQPEVLEVLAKQLVPKEMDAISWLTDALSWLKGVREGREGYVKLDKDQSLPNERFISYVRLLQLGWRKVVLEGTK